MILPGTLFRFIKYKKDYISLLNHCVNKVKRDKKYFGHTLHASQVNGNIMN